MLQVYSSESSRKPLGSGAMLQRNGLAAIKAIDPYLYEQ